jgi:hypothetical protein
MEAIARQLASRSSGRMIRAGSRKWSAQRNRGSDFFASQRNKVSTTSQEFDMTVLERDVTAALKLMGPSYAVSETGAAPWSKLRWSGAAGVS